MAYPFKGVAPALDKLLGQLNARAPRRSKLSDGALGDQAHAARTSFHNPNSAGIVQARDFTHDPSGGLDCNWLANQLVLCRDPRILEIIWKRRYWTPQGGWVQYFGTNPHDKHLHLTVASAPKLYNSTAPWNLGDLEDDDMTEDQAAQLAKIATFVEWFGTPDDDPKTAADESKPNSKGEGMKRIRDTHSGVMALLARSPVISGAELADMIPDTIAQDVVDALLARMKS